ncbi:MAG: double-strand break repair helicase AddA [Pseudomonadota bacterium]
MTTNPLSIDAIKKTTDKLQSQAADPHVSAWVSANAGTGKTYVLVQRVLRLLLDGADPERILCLTFTKAAASEMANRLFDKLSAWAVVDTGELTQILSALLGHTPSAKHIQEARKLFARALETPGGLKVQTIHAFCERLLQRFPLEASVAPHFTVLDEDTQKKLLTQSTNIVLSQAVFGQETKRFHELADALNTVVAYAGYDRFDDLLQTVIYNREALQRTIDAALGEGEISSLKESLRISMCRLLSISPRLTEKDLIDKASDLLSATEIKSAIDILSQGKTTDEKIAENLKQAHIATSPLAKYQAFKQAFLTTTGEPRSDKRFITKQIRTDHPNLVSYLTKARDELSTLCANVEAVNIANASSSLMVLADAILQNYQSAKTSQAALDFDDLIQKTSALLSMPGVSGWVLYKLDQGIDHILVDEAQDTSPQSWNVIAYLAEEFFSGAGARDVARTVFAVGDEKQSIYGFQGAEPKKFAQMGENFETRALHAELDWHRIPLTLSFRSTAPVLKSVDLVFSQSQALQGLTAQDTQVEHASFRYQQAGHVEIWETEKHIKEDASDPWISDDESAQTSPIVRLAQRISDTIKDWLDRGEILHSRGTPIRPGDILILVRKRAPFVAPMIRALKANHIPVAGADRIRIAEQLGVMDLMALGDFLLMPEDDLSLATILKSPFFDFTDDDLFAIGHDRRASLWEALNKRSDIKPDYEEATIMLRQWLARADLMPPFEFYSGVLLTRERRARFISRLGPEAGDAIDEFLNMAIQYDENEPPSLQGFLSWMRQSDTEIKRDMEQGRNEVRIMTVHGAKGLEAEIVFMPDTCSNKASQMNSALVEVNQNNDDQSYENASSFLWAIPGAKQQDNIISAREISAKKEREEYHRLLYVAMTRARDRLYICGFEDKTKQGRDKGCWYDLVRDGLSDHLVQDVDHSDQNIYFMGTPQSEPVDPGKDSIISQDHALDPPEWAFRKAPSEPIRTIPVSPSGLIPLDIDEKDEVDLGDQPAVSPRELAHENRFLRGLITHALLEHLPQMEEQHWEQAAKRLVHVRARQISKAVQDSIVQETLAVLSDPDFAPIFGSQSQSEVSITAKIPESETGAAPVLISGQIDRLAILEDKILLVDYKTNRPPPSLPEHVAESYFAQLVAYRRALREIEDGAMQGKPIKCALLWTDGPHLMEIPTALLDQVEVKLHASGWRRVKL